MITLTIAGALFALLHEPADGFSGLGVLMVPPFGWDEVCSYRPRRTWAERLAGQGHRVLRIDLPGTGDSAGSARDPGRVEHWTAAVADAARWLRTDGGCSEVAVIGLGLGGVLAHRAVAAGAPIDAVVSWATPARGRAVVRELQVFGRLEADEGGPDAPPVPDGELRAGGYTLSAETVAALKALDLTAMDGPRPARALLLGRDGIGPDAALADDLREHGSSVETDGGAGWGSLVAHPQRARLTEATAARVDAWLAAGRAPAGGVATAPVAARPLELDVDGRRVRETAVAVEHAAGTAYALLAEPASGAADAPVTVVLLNPGALRRSGPNRLWTEAARRWAARGIPVLRLDVRGIGDAEGDRDFSDDAALYEPELVEQVRAALDCVAARGLPDRFVVAGLCSGAAWAFQTAVADERVRTAAMLNPRVFFFDTWVGASRDWRRAVGALRPTRWRELAEAERPVARAIALLPYVATAPRRAVARRRTRAAERNGGDALEQALELLAARGQQLALRFSGNEPLHDELVVSGRLGLLLRRPGTSYGDLPGSSHTLKPLHAQRAAHAALDGILDAELARA